MAHHFVEQRIDVSKPTKPRLITQRPKRFEDSTWVFLVIVEHYPTTEPDPSRLIPILYPAASYCIEIIAFNEEYVEAPHIYLLSEILYDKLRRQVMLSPGSRIVAPGNTYTQELIGNYIFDRIRRIATSQDKFEVKISVTDSVDDSMIMTCPPNLTSSFGTVSKIVEERRTYVLY